MVELLLKIRGFILHLLYSQFLKRLFFLLDPETVHDRMTRNGQFLGRNLLTRKVTGALFSYQNPVLSQEIRGIKFRNPVGLAAGFDKDARLTRILPSVGFGFAEVGSITGEPCVGNPRPRLWRLPKARSLLIYYGLKNEGCEAIARRLSPENFEIPIGISVAKTNCAAAVDRRRGIEDYLKAYRTMLPIGDYTTINISCPNAYGGQPFTTPESLEALLTEIDKVPTTKPIFLKMPPDLGDEELDGLLAVASRHMVGGFISTNLTKDRGRPQIKDQGYPPVGGFSGKLVEDLANRQIEHIYRRTGGQSVIIGCGGVFSAKDAYRKIRLGASLIQLITGMIFEGPQLIGQINQGLVALLKRDGFTHISQAIGVDCAVGN